MENKPNRLIHEKSPYLLQHAYNPVDWFPWGPEAFEKAKREDKPIFLSIGYSTCHWCHVMEEESFSDENIAGILNEHFVCIKLDREERPDLDKIYMTAVTAMTGAGGWPLNVWLTPERKPFFGGTYFPPKPRWGRQGFDQVLLRIAELWKNRKEEILQSGDSLSRSMKDFMTTQPQETALEPSWLQNAFEKYQKGFDPSEGGFSGAPKFPMPVNLHFLLRVHSRTGSQEALRMVLFTLDKMRLGGINDQIGGGFHRYSTDGVWRVPHFEKMLYDNAQLASVYVEAASLSRDPSLTQAAQETLDYVLRDMAHPEGGFYSAEDADSLVPETGPKPGKKEGAFYLWSREEILKALGRPAGEILIYRYGIEPGGNTLSDPQGEFGGKNVLYARHNVEETAGKFNQPRAAIEKILAQAGKSLLKARAKRPHPHLDDKILTSWNGLMISALAKGAQVLGDNAYLDAAEKASSFIKKNLYAPGPAPAGGQLYRRWREGEKKIPAMLDDYAFLIQGLLDLYEATLKASWLKWAVVLTEEQNRKFYDPLEGGFYLTEKKHSTDLLFRIKEDSDNVEPSGNSVAALNLLRLGRITGRKDYEEAARKTLALFGSKMKEIPLSLPAMLSALSFALGPSREIVISGDLKEPGTISMLQAVQRRFIPNKILLHRGSDPGEIVDVAPFVKNLPPIRGKATAYVCANYVCDLPATDLKTLEKILDGSPK